MQVSSNFGGIVTRVWVKVGDHVAAGQALWSIDSVAKQRELDRYLAALESAQAKLAKDELGTRPEEIAKQKDQVAESEAQTEDAQGQLKLRESAIAEDARAVSVDEVNQTRPRHCGSGRQHWSFPGTNLSDCRVEPGRPT